MNVDEETTDESPRRQSRRAVTLSDVARHAGVSSAVVSYVINSGPRPVAAKTRQRVLRSIHALGYHPNAAAQALKRGSTNTIGVAVPNNMNPHFAELSRLVELAAEERGYETVFVNVPDNPGHGSRHIQKLLSHRINGMLIASAVSPREVVEVIESDTPLILLDRSGPFDAPDATPIDTVGVDFRAASRALVRHLIDVHGHDSVALVIGDIDVRSSAAREQGWRDAHREADRTPGPILRVPYTREGGLSAGSILFAARTPTAVFAASDTQAIGLLRAAHEAGLSVPHDVALVSFDGTQDSEYTWPPLTVMRQPVAAMAEAAVDLLLGTAATGVFHAFDTELVLRVSCGCAAGGTAATR